MMADMQAAQKRLDDLVSQMNAATGAEKVDRIAVVVTEMLAMHTQMSSMMMQGGMMQMMPKPRDATASRPERGLRHDSVRMHRAVSHPPDPESAGIVFGGGFPRLHNPVARKALNAPSSTCSVSLRRSHSLVARQSSYAIAE